MHGHRPAAPPSAKMRWIAFGLVLASSAAAFGFGRELLRSRQIDREIAALKEEADRLRDRNFEIASLHASLASGEYLEREARLKLNLQKEGERVVVVRKEDEPDALGAEPAAGPEWTNMKKWWTYFTDRQALEAYAHSRKTGS